MGRGIATRGSRSILATPAAQTHTLLRAGEGGRPGHGPESASVEAREAPLPLTATAAFASANCRFNTVISCW
jgi:hypothetical protein